MVEFELIRSPEELAVIVSHLINDIEKMKIEKDDPYLIDNKVKDCLKVVEELEENSNDEKWSKIAQEQRKFLESYVPKCNICQKNDAEDDGKHCNMCAKSAKYIDENNAVTDLYILAKDYPEKFFDLCGYTCYGCGLQIPNDKLKFCGKCKVLCYCCRKCQRFHWNKVHKKECKNVGLDFSKELDKERLLQLRALSQASLMAVYKYAIDKIKMQAQKK